MFHFQSVGYFCASLWKWKDFEKPCDKSLLAHIPNMHTSSVEHAVRHVRLKCHLCKCVSGRKGWEGRAVAVNLREGLHEVCAGRPGRAMGPAAVRHRVQPGQLHALPAVALYEPCTDTHTHIHTHSLHLLAKQDLVGAWGEPYCCSHLPKPVRRLLRSHWWLIVTISKQ